MAERWVGADPEGDGWGEGYELTAGEALAYAVEQSDKGPWGRRSVREVRMRPALLNGPRRSRPGVVDVRTPHLC